MYAVNQVSNRSIWEVCWPKDFQEAQSFIIGTSTTIHISAKRDNFLIHLEDFKSDFLQKFWFACRSLELHNKLSVSTNFIPKSDFPGSSKEVIKPIHGPWIMDSGHRYQ